MKIIFSVVKSGLGNNGGSQTIIRMALKLRELGHECYIISDCGCKFNWFKVPEDLHIRVPTDPKKWPTCDVIFATACTTWGGVLQYPFTPIKFYWIRGIERWKNSDAQLAQGYTSGLKLVVNSTWQKNYIKQTTGVDSTVVYSGIPFAMLEKACRNAQAKVFYKTTIGGLAHNSGHKGFGNYIKMCNHFGDKFIYAGFGITRHDTKVFDYYVRNADLHQKYEIFKGTNIWLATTVLDGFHIVPTEATIAGCALVCSSKETSGTRDYAIHNETALLYDDIKQAYMHIEALANDATLAKRLNMNMSILLKEKIGTVEKNAKRMLKAIS